MTWAHRRQFFYVIILVLFFAILGFIIIAPKLAKDPTCTDGKQNGAETGVDCGGACLNACSSQVEDVAVIWARAFKVVPGRYNAVAYIVNNNKNVAVRKINYKFRFADANNIYIGKREGSAYIPPAGTFAIFEPGIDIGNSVPVYVNFEFIQEPVWFQVSPEKFNQLKILVSDIRLMDETQSPRLSATIKNTSLFTIPDVSVVAILYDATGNAVSTSRTYLTKLAPLEGANIVFTWPEPFGSQVVAKEIIPMFDIFSAKLE